MSDCSPHRVCFACQEAPLSAPRHARSCGIGFAPARQGESDREFLLSLVEAVEDIPGAALNVGIDWSWETFPECALPRVGLHLLLVAPV